MICSREIFKAKHWVLWIHKRWCHHLLLLLRLTRLSFSLFVSLPACSISSLYQWHRCATLSHYSNQLVLLQPVVTADLLFYLLFCYPCQLIQIFLFSALTKILDGFKTDRSLHELGLGQKTKRYTLFQHLIFLLFNEIKRCNVGSIEKERRLIFL